MDARLAATPGRFAAIIWLDRTHALVARARHGHAEVAEVDRAFDTDPAFLQRVVHEAEGCDRLVVMGTDAARVAFEREYVALYQRPDRLIDVGQVVDPRACDLMDQLRILEPSLMAAN